MGTCAARRRRFPGRNEEALRGMDVKDEQSCGIRLEVNRTRKVVRKSGRVHVEGCGRLPSRQVLRIDLHATVAGITSLPVATTMPRREPRWHRRAWRRE